MKILITGDFCPINRVAILMAAKDFAPIYNDILSLSLKADLVITNLECPLTNHSEGVGKLGPVLKSTPDAIELLKYGGFNLVTLANNHILDYGEKGLLDTIDLLSQNEVSYVGAGMNNTEARKPFIFEKEGLKVGVLSIAENEWSTTHHINPGAAPLDEINNYYDISDLKKNVDFVIVISHGGIEMHNLPSPRVKKLNRFFIDAGADVVIGHHTHCFSGYEEYKGKQIFYSTGNFLFDRKDRNSKLWCEGMAIELVLDKTEITFRIFPFVQNHFEPGVRLMNEKETENFNIEVKTLNAIISNDALLLDEFQKAVDKNSLKYTRYIQPYTNILLLGLFNRGFLPNIWSRKKRLLLQNLVRSETHREILLKILK